MEKPAKDFPQEMIEDFCSRWKIAELALFGSVLREDFNSTSDIDVLAEFSADADWSLFDHVRMEQDLEAILGRKVDLVSKRGIKQSRNAIRRDEILSTAKVIYAAR